MPSADTMERDPGQRTGESTRSASSDLLRLVLGAAESAVGVPYEWGGNSLASGVDCSGLTQQAFRAAGINLPRVSGAQGQVGQQVPFDQARPGDLLHKNGHIAIYVGNGMMIESPRRGKTVRVVPVRSDMKGNVRRVLGVLPSSGPQPVTLGPTTSRGYTNAATSASSAAPPPTERPPENDPVGGEAGGGGLGDGLPPNATPEQIEEYIQANFPDVAPFLANTEIKMLLYAAAIEDWSDTKLDQALAKTEYYRTHGPSSRAFDITLATDRVAAREQIDRAMVAVDAAYRRQGVEKSRAEIGEIAKTAIRKAWTPEDLQRHVADTLLDEVDVAGLPAGEASGNADEYLAWARDMGLPLHRSTAQRWALDIAAGRETEDGVRAKVRNLARGQWQDPDILSYIDNGGTVRDYFLPFRDIIAKYTESNPESIDLLDDPKYAEITQRFDPTMNGGKGGKRAATAAEVTAWARDPKRAGHTEWFRQQRAATGSFLREWTGAR